MYIMRKLLGTIDLSETIIDSTITQQKKKKCCLFVYLGQSMGEYMVVQGQLMDRSRPIQKYKSG